MLLNGKEVIKLFKQLCHLGIKLTSYGSLGPLEKTLEIMQDDELMAAFREGVEALEKGETVGWDDVRRELGLV